MNPDSEKTVLYLGSHRNNSIASEVYIAKQDFDTKNLFSSPEHWEEIIDLLQNQANCPYKWVIVNMTESLMLIARKGRYLELFQRLLEAIKGYQHLFFFYEDNWHGKFNIFGKDYYTKYLYYEDRDSDPDYYAERLHLYEKYLDSLTVNAKLQYFCTLLPELARDASEHQWKYITSMQQFRQAFGMLSREKILKEEAKLRSFASVWLTENSSEELREEIEAFFESYLYQDTPPASGTAEALTASDDDSNRSDQAQSQPLTIAEKRAQETEVERFRFGKFYHRFLSEHNEVEKATVKQLDNLVAVVQDSGVHVCLYRGRNDISRSVRIFLKESDNVVFKQYFLKDYVFAEELENLLSVFVEYLTRVRNIKVSFYETKSDIGTVYVIASEDEQITSENFSDYVREFSDLVKLCDFDMQKASEYLQKEGISPREVTRIVSKYTTFYRRLCLDIEHDFKIRRLELDYHMKQELLSAQEHPAMIPYPSLAELKPGDLSAVMCLPESNYMNSVVTNNYFLGDFHYSQADQQMIDAITKYSDAAADLIKELNILKDKGLDDSTRGSSHEKLKKFLTGAAKKIGEFGFDLLSKYLENLMFPK